MERARSEDFVFVVVGDRNEKFCMSIVHRGSKVVAVLESELVRIASSSGVCNN